MWYINSLILIVFVLAVMWLLSDYHYLQMAIVTGVSILLYIVDYDTCQLKAVNIKEAPVNVKI